MPVLSGQEELKNKIQNSLNDLQEALKIRRDFWNKLSPEQQKTLIDRDSILTVSYTLYKFLKEFFGEL